MTENPKDQNEPSGEPLKKADHRKQRGNRGEELAERFLEGRGLSILGRNVRCALGEIDLVASDKGTVVFVEVRSRSGGKFGTPQESVTAAKQRRLTRLAQWYLKTHRMEGKSARFDVVAVTWVQGNPQVKWIPNAFEASS